MKRGEVEWYGENIKLLAIKEPLTSFKTIFYLIT